MTVKSPALPIHEIYKDTGHWIWIGNEGDWVSDTSFFGTTPEQWYTRLDDGSITLRRVDDQHPGGEIEILDFSGDDALVTYPRICPLHVAKTMLSLEDKTRLVFRANAEVSSCDFTMTREVVKTAAGPRLRVTISDAAKGLHGTQLFKRFPYYHVLNQSGGNMSLTMYRTLDFMGLFPSPELKVPLGTSFVEARTTGTEEEAAVVVLEDGLRMGSCRLTVADVAIVTSYSFLTY